VAFPMAACPMPIYCAVIDPAAHVLCWGPGGARSAHDLGDVLLAHDLCLELAMASVLCSALAEACALCFSAAAAGGLYFGHALVSGSCFS
jgi:hypothetical protein